MWQFYFSLLYEFRKRRNKPKTEAKAHAHYVKRLSPLGYDSFKDQMVIKFCWLAFVGLWTLLVTATARWVMKK